MVKVALFVVFPVQHIELISPWENMNNKLSMSMQFFLSNRAVYLLLWNVRLGYEHAGLDFWLSSIACHAPKAPVLVVGTHCDKVPPMNSLLL